MTLLGQTRPVHVQRLVISNTIEDRILELQDRKQSLADGSLGDRHGGYGPGREYCYALADFETGLTRFCAGLTVEDFVLCECPRVRIQYAR